MSLQKSDAHFHVHRQGYLRLDVSPKPSVVRAREPVTRSRGLVRGQFPSTKTGQMVAWESQLEEKACYLFEFCPAIAAFRDQPIKIEFPFGAKICTYTPDFELMFTNGQICYIEIKPLEKLFHPEKNDRFRCIANAFAASAQPFLVLTEEDLPDKQRVRNLNILRSYLRHLLPEVLTKSIAEWIVNARRYLPQRCEKSLVLPHSRSDNITPDRAEQLLRIDWFRNHIVHAGGEIQLALAFEHTGRHRQNRQLHAEFAADNARRRHAVHDRHLHIHQNGVKALRFVAQQRHRAFAVLGDFHCRAGIFEQAARDDLIQQIIFDHQ